MFWNLKLCCICRRGNLAFSAGKLRSETVCSSVDSLLLFTSADSRGKQPTDACPSPVSTSNGTCCLHLSISQPLLSLLLLLLSAATAAVRQQMEAFWEDSFTGIAYCRARWLLHASEIPNNGGASEDEVLITSVANDIKAANIMGLAPVTLAPVGIKPEVSSSPEVKPETEAPAVSGTRRSLRPKPRRSTKQGQGRGGGKRSKNATLYLSRSYDPFTAEFNVLPTDHPALVQLRKRERAESSFSNRSGCEKARGRLSNGRSFSRRKSSGGNGRVGVEREGLRGAELVVVAEPRRGSAIAAGRRSRSASSSDGYSSSSSGDGGCVSSSSASVSVGGNSDGDNSSSSNGFTSEDSQDDVLDDDVLDDDGVMDMAPTSYPRTRRGRRNQAIAKEAAAAAAAATVSTTTMPSSHKVEPIVTSEPKGAPKEESTSEMSLSVSIPAPPPTQHLPSRPRRLTMPPDDNHAFDLASGGDGDGNGNGNGCDTTTAASATGGRKSLLYGGPLVRMAHAGDDSDDGEDSPKFEQYPHKETDIGEDHQVEVPAMLLTEEERAADRETVETGEMGGTLVSGSIFIFIVRLFRCWVRVM